MLAWMSSGGSIFGIGVLYGYLALYPLRRGEAWAWWLFAGSGAPTFARAQVSAQP